jgi:D-alanyl-lipoteichoic acid acyltransferase DltB (MBOAT superfamily)
VIRFAWLDPATGAAVAVWRLLGGTARDPMNNPFASRTPADFWRRYNRPAQQFLYEDLFRPLGGQHSPIRATLATFAISALIHEYVFDIAVGRIQGYQTAFFLVQGLAVAATLGVKPKGWRAVPWTAGTWVFTLASSVLFFASGDEVVPFYTGRFTLSGGSSD